jgi:hypothetical protein
MLQGTPCVHDVGLRKTHSLEELGERCRSIDQGLRSLVDRAVPLTEYAWMKFRYPGEYDEPSLDEAAESRRLVEQVWDAVCARLPEEARPASKTVEPAPDVRSDPDIVSQRDH